MSDVKKINVGCGPYKYDGFVNIDKNPIWEPDLVLDVRNGLPFSNLEEIRAWHFIEHLSKDEIVQFLSECYNKLINNGMLDLLFPVGLTYELDHKTFLEKVSFEILFRGGKDDFYFGPKIAFTLESESRSSVPHCDMLRLIMRKRI
jgi:predicted SAM-dependent methyltransferase